MHAKMPKHPHMNNTENMNCTLTL